MLRFRYPVQQYCNSKAEVILINDQLAHQMIELTSPVILSLLFAVFRLQYGAAAAVSADVPPYELNVVPANLPAELTKLPDGENTKHIPRKIWMAVKDINDELPGHIKAFFQRNPNWDATVCDNDCKDKFMNTTFAGILSL